MRDGHGAVWGAEETCEGKDRLKGKVGVNKVGFLQEFKTYEYIFSMTAKPSIPLVFYSNESKYIETKVGKWVSEFIFSLISKDKRGFYPHSL